MRQNRRGQPVTYRISLPNFAFIFTSQSNRDSLSLFWFEKQHIGKVIDVNGWLLPQIATRRNRYAVDPLLLCCIMLCRLPTLSICAFFEVTFGKYSSQLYKIFLEEVDWLRKTMHNILSVGLSYHIFHIPAEIYTESTQ